MNYKFSLVFLFKIIWFVSTIAKLVYPRSALSWLKAFLYKLLYHLELGINIPITLLQVSLNIVIVMEFITMIYLSKKRIASLYLNVMLLFIFFSLSVIAYFLRIPGDCGCFGKIIVWEKDLYKIAFNTLLLVLATVLLITTRKSKNEEITGP